MFAKQVFSSLLYKNGINIAQSQFLRTLHVSNVLKKVEDRKEMLASMPVKDEGTTGEKSIDIDTLLKK